MTYEDNLQSLLLNDSGVQAAVDSWVLSSTTYYMVFKGTLLPKSQQSDSGLFQIDAKHKTINHYRTTPIGGGKPADHGACELDLSNSSPQGGWYIGEPTQHTGQPPYNSTFRYLFEIPKTWADEYTGGRLLVTGGSRYGNYVFNI